MDPHDISRVQPGVPAGGQFAERARQESDVVLAASVASGGWSDLGYSDEEAMSWMDSGFTFERAEEWTNHGFY